MSGYSEGSWSCSNGDGGPYNSGSVTLTLSQSVTCTISNDDQPASLTVVKNVVNDDGGTAVVGDFSITTSAGNLIFGAGVTVDDTTTYTAMALSVDANTAYSLSEADVSGYSEGSWSCSNGDGGPYNSGSVTLNEDQSVSSLATRYY